MKIEFYNGDKYSPETVLLHEHETLLNSFVDARAYAERKVRKCPALAGKDVQCHFTRFGDELSFCYIKLNDE